MAATLSVRSVASCVGAGIASSSGQRTEAGVPRRLSGNRVAFQGRSSTFMGSNVAIAPAAQPTARCATAKVQATLDPVRNPLYGRTHSSMWMKNQYTFEVDNRATKTDIRSFLEAVFQVRVVSVNTWRLPNKKTRRGGSEGVRVRRKRATATVAWGQRMRVYPDPKSYIND